MLVDEKLLFKNKTKKCNLKIELETFLATQTKIKQIKLYTNKIMCVGSIHCYGTCIYMYV